MSESTNLPTVIERASKALSKVDVEARIKELVEQSKPIVAVTDAASREVCHDALMVLVKMRTQTQKRAKDGRDEAVQYSKAVIAIERELVGLIEPEETRLAQLRDAWDAKLAAEKQAKIDAEIARVTEIQRQIDIVRNWPIKAANQTVEIVHLMLVAAQDFKVDEAVFQERSEEAANMAATSAMVLVGLLQQRREHEAAQEQLKRDQEELRQRRAADAERELIAAQERAKERAENARIARERQAELDRQAEEQRQANAAEAPRLADERAKLAADQEALRKANEPKPKPRKAPTGAELVEVVSKHYGVTSKTALQWLLKIDWQEAKAS